MWTLLVIPIAVGLALGTIGTLLIGGFAIAAYASHVEKE